jgi:hypothetical protein
MNVDGRRVEVDLRKDGWHAKDEMRIKGVSEITIAKREGRRKHVVPRLHLVE